MTTNIINFTSSSFADSKWGSAIVFNGLENSLECSFNNIET